jgi:hypothetical protein
LELSYHPDAGDNITDHNIRARVAVSLRKLDLSYIAAFAGRERQFRYAVRTTNIVWLRNDLFQAKVFPNSIVNGKISDAFLYNQIHSLRRAPDSSNDVATQIRIRNDLADYISQASDRVSLSDFATQAQYEKALKRQLVGMLSAEKNTDKPRFSFDVVSGKLEMPALVTTGWLEIKAGEVDVYQLAASVAQVVFSSSSVNTATEQPQLDQDASPAATVVQNEELNRRELERSLAPSDLPYVRSIAADLFVQQS